MNLKKLLRQEHGGILVLALAFMALAVPLTTATLAFVSTLSRHSVVQQELFQTQYGGMGVKEYAIQKLVTANNEGTEAVEDLLSDPEEITLNERDYTINWSYASEPDNEPEAPPVVFQTAKTVDPTTVPAGQINTATYTIDVHNTGSAPKTLERILDSLPSGFSYVANSSILTVGEATTTPEPSIEEFNPPQGAAGRVELLEWVLDGVEVDPGGQVTLVFQVETFAEIAEGAYCNIAWVDPGGHATVTPPGSAKLLVGTPEVTTQCANEFLKATKKVCVATDGPCDPEPKVTVPLHEDNTYKYTIEAENQWDQTVYLCFLFDVLPAGLTWNGNYTSEVGTQSVFEDGDNDQQINFRFHPNCTNTSRVINPNQTRTFTLEAEGSLGFGENEDGVHPNVVRLMVALGSTSGPIAWAFSGLTAEVIVYNVFWITVFNATSGTTERVEVWIDAGGNASVGQWQPIE